jgi:cysteine desulfuration protein SufE
MGRPLSVHHRAWPYARSASEGGAYRANKVQGCASQVWLTTFVRPDGSGGPILTFRGDSDAHIVRGLIAILFALYSDKSARDILATDPLVLFERLGLREHLAPQRSNGLKSMRASAPKRRPPSCSQSIQ